jgi:hypothetical protein
MLLRLGTAALIVTAFAMAMPPAANAECVTLRGDVFSPRKDDPLRLVFTGRVTGRGDLAVSFEVDRVWSGRVNRHTTIVFFPGLENWNAWDFNVGVEYVVDAFNIGGAAPVELGLSRDSPFYEARSRPCSATDTVAGNEDRIRQFGPAHLPRP